MAYNNPNVPTIASPKGIDAVIQKLQIDLSVLPWLTKSFGRAWMQREKRFRKVQRREQGEYMETQQQYGARFPQVYQGKGEYLNVLPNDFLVAQSFFYVTGPEEWLSTDDRWNRKTRPLSLIVWGNLKKINRSKDYVFTEELKADVADILKSNSNLVQIDSYIDEDVEAVFREFTISDIDTKYMTYPFAGFRFDLNASYYEDGDC